MDSKIQEIEIFHNVEKITTEQYSDFKDFMNKMKLLIGLIKMESLYLNVKKW